MQNCFHCPLCIGEHDGCENRKHIDDIPFKIIKTSTAETANAEVLFFFKLPFITSQALNISVTDYLQSNIKRRMVTSTRLLICGTSRSMRTSISITRALQTFFLTSGSSSLDRKNKFLTNNTTAHTHIQYHSHTQQQQKQ